MRATSKASFEAASERWEPVLAKAAGRGVRFGQELYELSDLLERNVSLSRALTDPSRSAPDKAALVESIARGKVDDEVADLLVDLVQLRWSAPTNLSHALEVLAVDAILASAQARGALETVEDEIFRFGRLLASERELRRALADKQVSIERRLALADGLVAGKVQPESQLFIHRSLSDLRARSIFSALHSIGDRAAARRARLVATVIAASPLTAAQAARLRSILEQAYGRSVRVNVGVDEKLVGGLRIAIGSDLVDASIVGRLDEARRRLAG